MHNKLLVISVFMLTSVLAACSSAQAVEPEMVGDPQIGREIFENTQRNRCVSCHNLDDGDIPEGPSLQGISERAGERVPGLSAIEYLQQSILDPSAFIVDGYQNRMKVYQIVDEDEVEYMFAHMLTQEEMEDLIAYLLTQ
ncbi:MAG: cytochrome c [Anaerolineales bacterium]